MDGHFEPRIREVLTGQKEKNVTRGSPFSFIVTLFIQLKTETQFLSLLSRPVVCAVLLASNGHERNSRSPLTLLTLRLILPWTFSLFSPPSFKEKKGPFTLSPSEKRGCFCRFTCKVCTNFGHRVAWLRAREKSEYTL